MNREIIKNILFIIVFFSISFLIAKVKVPEGRELEKDYRFNYVNTPDSEISNNTSMIVYIWATWCGVCKANKIPVELNYKISKMFGIKFISLEEGENIEELKTYLTQNPVNYPVGILDPDLSDQFEVREYPSFIYIHQNKIILKDTGIVNPFSFLLRLLYLKIFF